MEFAGGLSFPVAFGAGLVSFFSPCVLPLVPSYISVISGVSYDDLRHQADRNHTLRRTILAKSLLFILGFAVVFVALGTSFTLLGQALSEHRGIITKVGGILIIFFGLYTAGVLKFGTLLREFHVFETSAAPVGVFGPFLVGLSFGLAWTPCIGPTLGAILTLASMSDNVTQGTVLLVVYTAGLALPFFLSSLAFNGFLNLFGRINAVLPALQKIGGVVLIIMGVLLFTGYLTLLNSYAISLTPQWLWRWL
jgi:cytochrome c-type biogenesis protein